jgi:NAD(P)-dependent dehydrogenase (short-subunit alcohol dehydrogenase family)
MAGDATDEGPAEALANEIKAAGGAAVANTDSVATPEGGMAIIESALDAFGSVDIVIHSAGNVRRGALAEFTYEDFEQVLDVHLARRVSMSCGRRLSADAEQGHGRFVLTGIDQRTLRQGQQRQLRDLERLA